jgi:hypothetical protein
MQNNFREYDGVTFLVRCDFDGMIKRYAEKGVQVGDQFFEGKISSIGQIGNSFNLLTFKQGNSNVSVSIINDDRLQDEEQNRVLDGAFCEVYAYRDGLTWAELQNGHLIYSGVFKKESHTERLYNFSIEDASLRRLKRISGDYITDSTFSNHRKEGGSGSVSGNSMPTVFGDFGGGIPLLCIDTVAFKYLLSLGTVKSEDAEYTATTENVYDKDGDVIAAAGFTFYTNGYSEAGPYSYFDFTGDQVANEKLSCSCRGLTDGEGLITGTAGTLIEHPAHIVHYMIKNYGINIEAHEESIGTLKAIFPYVKFAVYINQSSGANDIIDRVLSQVLASAAFINGQLGVMMIDPSAEPLARFSDSNHIDNSSVIFYKTDIENVCNSLTINYSLNVATGKYESQEKKTRHNSNLCKESYFQYGERPDVVLNLPDIRDSNSIDTIARRYLSIHAFRHDIIKVTTSYHDTFHLNTGNAALWTLKDGPSASGDGWVNEKFILLDKQFTKNGIVQRWWRVNSP